MNWAIVRDHIGSHETINTSEFKYSNNFIGHYPMSLVIIQIIITWDSSETPVCWAGREYILHAWYLRNDDVNKRTNAIHVAWRKNSILHSEQEAINDTT